MSDLWSALRERLDYARFVPKLTLDLERFEYRTRAGERRIVIKNPGGDSGAGTYLTLTEADEALLARMEGDRSIQKILVDHLLDTGVFALDRLGRLTALLAANGFFGEERPNVFVHLARRRMLRQPLTRLRNLLRRLVLWPIASWPNADPVAELLYRLGGRVFFTRLGALALGLFIAAGVWVWMQETARPRHDLFRVNGSYTLGLGVFIVLLVVGITFHELGHALAIRHYGRKVRRLGFVFYYLMPCAYVDSTDMVMAPRSARIVVSIAGAVAGLAFAAIAAFTAAASPEGSLTGSIALKAASLLVFNNLFQLLPILELDGYLVLVDLVDVPLLRQRSLTYLRTRFFQRLARRAKLSTEERGLAAYGAVAFLSSIAALFFGIWIWQARFGALLRELWDVGVAGQLALAAIAVIFLGPLVLGLVALMLGWGGAALAVVRRGQMAGELRRVVERAETLKRTSLFRDLTPAELKALASQFEERQVEEGDVIVREGEPGDRFFVVAEGEAEVVQGPEERKLRDLRPGDPFGEIALLEGGIRTATVRARTPMRLFVLDRSHFHRWARDRVAATGRMRASLEERERIAGVPLFADLSAGQLDQLVARLRPRRFPAGEPVFKQGEPGDRFYVIAEGEADLYIDGRRVKTLAPGGFFGEVALLTPLPRTAGVKARTDLLLYALDKRAFDELVRGSIDREAVAQLFGTYQRPVLGMPARSS